MGEQMSESFKRLRLRAFIDYQGFENRMTELLDIQGQQNDKIIELLEGLVKATERNKPFSRIGSGPG